MPSTAPSHDEDGGVLGLIAGSGIMLMQAAAVVPGLLPVLLLILPLVVPLVVLGVAGGVLVGVPLGLWRLGVWVVGFWAGREHRVPRRPSTRWQPTERFPTDDIRSSAVTGRRLWRKRLHRPSDRARA